MRFHLGNLAELSTRLSSPDKALTGEPCQGSAGLTFSTGPGRGRLGALSLGGVNTSQSTYLKIWGLKKKNKQTNPPLFPAVVLLPSREDQRVENVVT